MAKEKKSDELINANKALVASEERYRRLFEAAQDGILILNADTGMIEDVNPYMIEMLGYSHTEFLGKELWEIGLFSDINANKEAFLKLKEEGYIRYKDLPLKTKKGLPISVEFVSNRYDVSGGQVIQCNIRNITERKIVEENNKRLTERLQLATQSAKLGIWEWDIKNNILKCDERMYHLYDLDEVEFESVYDGWLSRLHPEDIERVNHSIQQALLGKEDYNPTFRLVWKDSSVHYIEASGLIERDAQGNAIRMIGTNWDITERRKSEIALQKSEARLKGIIASQSTYVLRTDLQGDYTYCNPKFIDDFGWLYSKDNSTLIGMNGMVSIMPYHHQAVKHIVEKCFGNPNQVFQIEIDKPAKSYGVKTTLWDFILLTDQEGRPEEIQCAGIEITDRKKAEIELKQINEQLLKQTKDLEISNAELEQFAFATSHDLQEPLRMITSFLAQLERKYGHVIDDKGKEYINFAVDGAKRMRQIILDLLEFSRVGKTEDRLEYLNLNDLLSEIKLLLRKSIEDKKATISIDELPEIHFFRSPVRQVFQNLISNALKYSSKDIPVQINITVKEFNDHWLFAIIDNGIGIEKEYFEKIFILFQRLHNRNDYSGTGIGLAVTKKIIGTLGGKIWVESEIGKGSSFYFTIKK